MRDLTAMLFGVSVIMVARGLIPRGFDLFFFSGLASLGLCLLVWHILTRLHHPAVLMMLAVGLPVMSMIYVAAVQPLFIYLFYGLMLVIILTGVASAALTSKLNWEQLGINISYFFAVLAIPTIVASYFGSTYLEGAILAVIAFSITRLCHINIFWLLSKIPRLVFRGMAKIWF